MDWINFVKLCCWRNSNFRYNVQEKKLIWTYETRKVKVFCVVFVVSIKLLRNSQNVIIIQLVAFVYGFRDDQITGHNRNFGQIFRVFFERKTSPPFGFSRAENLLLSVNERFIRLFFNKVKAVFYLYSLVDCNWSLAILANFAYSIRVRDGWHGTKSLVSFAWNVVVVFLRNYRIVIPSWMLATFDFQWWYVPCHN